MMGGRDESVRYNSESKNREDIVKNRVNTVNSLIEYIELKRVNKNNIFNGNMNRKNNNDPSTYVNSRKYSHT
jgi:hypothetical protein